MSEGAGGAGSGDPAGAAGAREADADLAARAEGLARRQGLDLASPFTEILLRRLSEGDATSPPDDGDATDHEASSARVLRAVGQLAAGRPVLVVDDTDRENEGDLVMAADAVTRDWVAFVLEHSSGLICVALTGERCDELGLPVMVDAPTDPLGTAYTVTVDVVGTTTGISAGDRAATVAALADPARVAADFRRPGHILPLRARPGGVLERRGHTEAAVDLARLAGRAPAALICEVVTGDRLGMARRPELRRLAARFDLAYLSVADVALHRSGPRDPAGA